MPPGTRGARMTVKTAPVLGLAGRALMRVKEAAPCGRKRMRKPSSFVDLSVKLMTGSQLTLMPQLLMTGSARKQDEGIAHGSGRHQDRNTADGDDPFK